MTGFGVGILRRNWTIWGCLRTAFRTDCFQSLYLKSVSRRFGRKWFWKRQPVPFLPLLSKIKRRQEYAPFGNPLYGARMHLLTGTSTTFLRHCGGDHWLKMACVRGEALAEGMGIGDTVPHMSLLAALHGLECFDPPLVEVRGAGGMRDRLLDMQKARHF